MINKITILMQKLQKEADVFLFFLKIKKTFPFTIQKSIHLSVMRLCRTINQSTMSRHNLLLITLIINFPVYEARRMKKRKYLVSLVQMNVLKKNHRITLSFFQTASPHATSTSLDKEATWNLILSCIVPCAASHSGDRFAPGLPDT